MHIPFVFDLCTSENRTQTFILVLFVQCIILFRSESVCRLFQTHFPLSHSAAVLQNMALVHCVCIYIISLDARKKNAPRETSYSRKSEECRRFAYAVAETREGRLGMC